MVNKLTEQEWADVVNYTIQKIENYPKEWGYTVENYFEPLIFDEVKNYLFRKQIKLRQF